jgi:pSer/pThr/pTyr-binding forkhead associated (FHA) protein
MSREHFKITLIDGFYVLDDLDSLNGTFVNDDPQPIKESVILRAGTMIRVEM